MKDSKNKLLHTAFELFALRGLDGVSTREIVKKAGCNIHAISYYFGGKEGLYKAVLDYVAECGKEESRAYLHFEDYCNALPSLDKKQSLDLLLRICDDLIDFGFANKNMYIGLMLTREEFAPSKYNKRFLEKLKSPMQGFITNCVAKITGLKEKEPENIFLCYMLMSQVLCFGRGKNFLLKFLNMKNIPPQTVNLVKQMVRINVKAILKEYIKEQ